MQEKIIEKAKKFADRYIPKMTQYAAPIVKREVNTVITQSKEDIFKQAKGLIKVVGVGAILIGYFASSDTIQKKELLDRAINITYNEIHVVNNYKGGNEYGKEKLS